MVEAVDSKVQGPNVVRWKKVVVLVLSNGRILHSPPEVVSEI